MPKCVQKVSKCVQMGLMALLPNQYPPPRMVPPDVPPSNLPNRPATPPPWLLLTAGSRVVGICCLAISYRFGKRVPGRFNFRTPCQA